MSNKEEIREGIAKTLWLDGDRCTTELDGYWDTMLVVNKNKWLRKASIVQSYLHSQGVVIKVEKEVPTLTIDSVGVLHTGDNFEGEWVKKEAGCVAVESLI